MELSPNHPLFYIWRLAFPITPGDSPCPRDLHTAPSTTRQTILCFGESGVSLIPLESEQPLISILSLLIIQVKKTDKSEWVGQMEMVGYVASGEGFFETPCCIDCSVEEYCAFPDADRVLEVDRVYEKKLVDIGEGVLISEPVVVEGLEVEGKWFYASLSHQGILAIYSYDGKDIVQFTNLRNGEQVEMEVEDWSNVAFYDDKVILLTDCKPLREARVEEVFDEHNISVFKRIGDVDSVEPSADSSLLNSRRILCYRSTECIPYEYNVDAEENKMIDTEQEIWVFSSMMGIDCGVKGVFQDVNDYFTYTLGWDNKVTPLHEVREEWGLASLFVTPASPKDLSKSVLRYSDYLIKGGNKIDPRRPIYFDPDQSVIRIYRDIFLLYDMNTKKWVLCRILVP